jgi:hypothetical protein
VSKESRRAARLARESRRTGAAPEPGAEPRPADTTGPASASTDPTVPRTTRTSRSGIAAGPTTRAGRRERVRAAPRRTFLERYRAAIVAVAAVAVVALAVGYIFVGSTQPAYACTNQFAPSPTPPLAPDSSDRLGFFQDDMGNSHVVSPPQRYLYCPPASGNHFNGSGIGPIAPRVYRPEDKIGPSNWIHNLEHGGLVVLYRGDSPGAAAAGLQAFRDFFDSFPASPICKIPGGQLSPVIARFDTMPHAYAALVWDRVFYLDTWDPALVTKFFLTEAERLDANGDLIAPVEDVSQCATRLASAAPSGSAGSPAASVDVSAAPPSAAPSVAPSASSAPSAAPS